MGAREPLAESYTYPEPVFHEPASVPGNSRAALVVAPGIGDVHIASGALPDLSQSAAKAPGGDLGFAVAVAFFNPQLGERFLILRFVPCFLGGVISTDTGRLQKAASGLAVASRYCDGLFDLDDG